MAFGLSFAWPACFSLPGWQIGKLYQVFSHCQNFSAYKRLFLALYCMILCFLFVSQTHMKHIFEQFQNPWPLPTGSQTQFWGAMEPEPGLQCLALKKETVVL